MDAVLRRRPGSQIPAIVLAAILLAWPSMWNGYPLVFSDTGTYLSQAIHHYLGWDRPAIYSLFLYPLHFQFSLWPVVAAQALLTACTLHLTRRVLWPQAPDWFLPAAAFGLAVCTSLPWHVSQVMPDVFTPLLVIAMTLLILAPDRLSRPELVWLTLFATFMIAAHQSHVPLALALLVGLLPLRHWLGAAPRGPERWQRHWIAMLPPLVACLALVAMNAVGHGRVSLSPFGNVFLLARVIEDGPGMIALRENCPAAGWRLCDELDRLPATSDDFLWRDDGALARAGGAKQVSAEASAILVAAWRADPVGIVGAFFTHFGQQAMAFATGDGLEAWPRTVTPWIERDFPGSEQNAYAASRQTAGKMAVPDWLGQLHVIVAASGIAGCGGLLLRRRRDLASGFAVAALLAVLCNAAITGGLSGPHRRYQSRIVWLPAFVVMLAIPSMWRGSLAADAAAKGWLCVTSRLPSRLDILLLGEG